MNMKKKLNLNKLKLKMYKLFCFYRMIRIILNDRILPIIIKLK